MSTSDASIPATGGDDPLHQFSDCHAGILSRLQALAGLPALARAATQARQTAADTIAFFRDAIVEHHAQEEKELFPAVRASAAPGDERRQVEQIVERLTREHREIESRWAQLEPALKHVARGRDAVVDDDAVGALVARYQEHATYEEQVFLPLSQRILGRDGQHMAALGLSLHMRHALPEALARYRGRI
jgi:hemerythrin-like domain-containing protein